MTRILTLIKEAIFRVAFGIAILIQLLLWLLLWGGIGTLLERHNSFVFGPLIGIGLLGPFFVGAANYFIYYRIVREEYIPRQAEKWLAERRTTDDRVRRRRRLTQHLGLWAPTVVAILVCTFLDYTWGFASHLLHPGRGKLIGYEVSIPLAWTFVYPNVGARADGSYDAVVASRFRGLWKAGGGIYGHRPPFHVSTMDFATHPGGNERAVKPLGAIISERVLHLDRLTITCGEETPPTWAWENRYIACSSLTGDFSAGFVGDDRDAVEFYGVIETLKIH
jgi:hypothetical protein